MYRFTATKILGYCSCLSTIKFLLRVALQIMQHVLKLCSSRFRSVMVENIFNNDSRQCLPSSICQTKGLFLMSTPLTWHPNLHNVMTLGKKQLEDSSPWNFLFSIPFCLTSSPQYFVDVKTLFSYIYIHNSVIWGLFIFYDKLFVPQVQTIILLF